MASIVVVCPDLPFPPNSGGNVKSYFLLEHLCASHDVSLVSVLKGGSERHLEGISEALPLRAVVSAKVDRDRTMVNFARAVLSRQTMNEWRTYTPDIGRRALPLFDAADCIVVDHLEVMQYVPQRHWPKTLFHTHNAEYVLWQRKAEISTSMADRVGAAIEARRIAARERRYCNGVAAVLAAPDDQRALERAGATNASFHRTYHLGDDAKRSLPDVQWSETEPLVFYMGALSWEPNIDGLERFIDEAWPEVRRARTDARLVVGGANPPESLLRRAQGDTGIEVVGFIDEPESFYGRARVTIAPLRFGSGMKLKVLEALTRGTPTVTTPIGVESIDAVHGEHLMVADSVAEMAGPVLTLLGDQQIWEGMRDASRALVRDRYTWAVVRADFDAALTEVLERAEVRRSS